MVVLKMVKNGNNSHLGIHNQSLFLIELPRAALPIDYALEYIDETAFGQFRTNTAKPTFQGNSNLNLIAF